MPEKTNKRKAEPGKAPAKKTATAKPKAKTTRGKPFKKDDPRINREGRPKKGEALTDILNTVLDEVDSSGKMRREIIAEKIVELAEKGDIIALKYIFDRTDGKPIETIKADVKGDIINVDGVVKKLEDMLLNDHGRI